MSVLAQAPEAELMRYWKSLRKKPAFAWLKKPEHGSILLRGRINGDGSGFHFGEMTATRCIIQLEDGRTGVAYVPGRSHAHAMMAAVLDALLQSDDARARKIVTSLRVNQMARRAEAMAKTETTRVDFTMTAIG
ncbi:phosphonate C-P lyase system protein PhnG [Microbacteriaceae bacterium K1510]|nr:phosphonate C-P lyase system protein PhnG [Microbacteriaceae bacterium K1510]